MLGNSVPWSDWALSSRLNPPRVRLKTSMLFLKVRGKTDAYVMIILRCNDVNVFCQSTEFK